MKSFGILALLLGVVMARAEPVPAKVNQAESKNGHQVTKPTSLETASTRNQNSQIPHPQYQSSEMANTHGEDLKLSQHPQLQNSQFHNQEQAAQFYSHASEFRTQDQSQQFRNQDMPEEFRNRNQAHQFYDQNQAHQFHDQNQAHQFHDQNQAHQFHDQNQAQQLHSQIQSHQIHSSNQAEQLHNQIQTQQLHNQIQSQQLHNQIQAQQFHNQDQSQQYRSQGQMIAGSPDHQDQEISSLLQSQQQMTPTAVSSIHSQMKEQVRDFSVHQHSGNVHPQQGFYQDRRNMINVQDQQIRRQFDDMSSQKTNLFSGLQSTEIKSGVLPQVHSQVSAFGKGIQPIVLPKMSHAQSTSVVVSGLKNLPSLPALVYSAGTVPSSAHVLPYGRPWHMGGAYVRQHWETPYARYVYSHIL